MAIVVAVIVARSAIFIFWEQCYFDADQAVIGLMGKHRSEAVLISRTPCSDARPVVPGLYLCPP